MPNRLTEGGVEPTRVFARDGALEADEWLHVGDVAVSSDGSVDQAVQYQKRLILEHAARVNPRLAVAQKTLDTGFETGGEISKLVKPASMPDTLSCGFVGASGLSSARCRARLVTPSGPIRRRA